MVDGASEQRRRSPGDGASHRDHRMMGLELCRLPTKPTFLVPVMLAWEVYTGSIPMGLVPGHSPVSHGVF